LNIKLLLFSKSHIWQKMHVDQNLRHHGICHNDTIKNAVLGIWDRYVECRVKLCATTRIKKDDNLDMMEYWIKHTCHRGTSAVTILQQCNGSTYHSFYCNAECHVFIVKLSVIVPKVLRQNVPTSIVVRPSADVSTFLARTASICVDKNVSKHLEPDLDSTMD